MFIDIIRDAAVLVSPDIHVHQVIYGYLTEVELNGECRHIKKQQFDLNTQASGNICADKSATYAILSRNGIPAILHHFVGRDDSSYGGIDCDEMLRKYGKVVVKPNNGAKGENVYTCETLDEVDDSLARIRDSGDDAVICPYYDIDVEYRTFMLDGEAYLVYGKHRPSVVGDGERSIAQLIADVCVPSDSRIELDTDYIPVAGERIVVAWKHNLTNGAMPFPPPNEETRDAVVGIAKAAVVALNVRFCTVDVAHCQDGEYRVIEVNSGVCAIKLLEQSDDDTKDRIMHMYADAIRKMFE